MTTPPDGPDRSAFDDLDLARETMQSVLQRVATQAKHAIPGVAEASVTVVERGRPTSAAWTGLLAFELDETQFGLEYGPCLSAAASGEVVAIADMATEERWERFTPLALRQGALASLSTPIPFQHDLQAALNCYATQPHVFDAAAEAQARGIVGRAAVVISNMHAYDSTRRTVENLQEAMRSRAVIEQAKGILMGRAGISSAEAFETLARRSQDANRKLRDIARELVAEVTGEGQDENRDGGRDGDAGSHGVDGRDGGRR